MGVATIALAGRRVPGRRRSPDVIDWSEAGELFASDRSLDRQAAELGGLHPAQMADAVRLAVEQKADRNDIVEPLERLAQMVERLAPAEQDQAGAGQA